MADQPLDHRPIVIGPGAIGGALAAALHEVDRTPLLVARSRFRRLVVDHPTGRVEASVEVVTEADAVRPTSLVVLATKTYQTESVAGILQAACAPGTRLMVAQNGISHVERVVPLVPDGVDVVPAIVFVPATRSEAGRVRVTGTLRIDLPDTEAGRWLAGSFAGSFLSVVTTASWRESAWSKLALNAALGAMGVLTGSPNSTFLSDPEGRALTRALMEEVVAVGRAEGVDLRPDLSDRLVRRAEGHAGGHLSSITADRLAGAPTEWRDRNEIVSVLGRRRGVPTPLNDLVTTLLRLGEPAEAGQRTSRRRTEA